MPLQEQNIPIHFGQGVDTKTDPKMVPAGKMLRLQDAVFTAASEVSKRNGYQKLTNAILGGGNLTAPKMINAYQDELVCADQGAFYSYSESQLAWVNKGRWNPVAVSKQSVSRTNLGNQIYTSSAIVGNVALFAWQTVSGATNIITISAIDLSTGVKILADTAILTRSVVSSQSTCVALAGTTLAIYYTKDNSDIAYRTLTLATGSASISSESIAVVTGGLFQLATSSAGAVLMRPTAPAANTSWKVSLIDSAGAVTSTVTVTTPEIATRTFYINVNAADGRIWIYWEITPNVGTINSVYYSVLSNALATVKAVTKVMDLPSSVAALSITAAQYSITNQMVLVCYLDQTAPGGGPLDYGRTTILSQEVSTTAIVGVTSTFLKGHWIASNVAIIGGEFYVGCNSFSSTQGSLFFINVATGYLLAKAALTVAPPVLANGTQAFFFPTIPSVYGTKLVVPFGELYNLAAGSGSLGISYVAIDSVNDDLYQSLNVNANKTLLLNGGIIAAYDGNSLTELGFNTIPEIVRIVGSGGPALPAGTYGYAVTYQWTDAQGNFYESAPSVEKSIAVGGASSVVLYIRTLALSKKTNVNIIIYRTDVNGTLLKVWTVKPNDPAADYLVYNDTTGASTGTGNPIYTSGGVIENIAPPATLALTHFNNRVWLIDRENPNTLWYTKSLQPGTGVNFSDLLQVQVDAIGGDCIALAPMDEKLLILEERQPLVMTGDGANDAGGGSTLSTPQPIPSDVGVVSHKGVATYPMGVMFKSPKGVYLLDRAMSIKYLGLEVEAYNGQTISASTMIADKTQIRFLTPSGLTLVYDYLIGQWSTFTNHQGYAATIWRGAYVYVRTDGNIYKETPNYYLDDTTAIAPLAQTAWLNLAGIQGLQRVRLFEMLGDYVNGLSAGHGVQVQAAYDFVPTFSSPVAFSFGSASSSGVYQYRQHLARQKCDSVSFLIQEIATGDSAESITLTDMSFEAGVKKGLNRTSASRSVG